MRVIILAESVKSHKKATNTRGNLVRLKRLVKAAKKGDEGATKRVSGVKKSVYSRASFLRAMFRD